MARRKRPPEYTWPLPKPLPNPQPAKQPKLHAIANDAQTLCGDTGVSRERAVPIEEFIATNRPKCKGCSNVANGQRRHRRGVSINLETRVVIADQSAQRRMQAEKMRWQEELRRTQAAAKRAKERAVPEERIRAAGDAMNRVLSGHFEGNRRRH